VCVDFKSAGAYLAVQPTIAMAREAGIDLQWQIIHTPALREPIDPGAKPDRAALHKYTRGRYVLDDLRRYAAHELSGLHDAQRSDFAAAGLLWVINNQGDVHAYIIAVFARFWQQRANIDSVADIAEVLAGLGIEVSGFAGFVETCGVAQAQSQREDLAGQGVSFSPTYLLEGELFQGRQHLPLLRSLLYG
jgi:2-hydroxychromene-2-carboxylate isomerase